MLRERGGGDIGSYLGVPHRTGEMQRGWMKEGKGVKARAVNRVPYSPYVMGTGKQSRHEKLVGWKVIAEIIKLNMKGAIRHAEAAIRKYRRGK